MVICHWKFFEYTQFNIKRLVSYWWLEFKILIGLTLLRYLTMFWNWRTDVSRPLTCTHSVITYSHLAANVSDLKVNSKNWKMSQDSIPPTYLAVNVTKLLLLLTSVIDTSWFDRSVILLRSYRICAIHGVALPIKFCIFGFAIEIICLCQSASVRNRFSCY